jgi:hypothetical protein
MKNRDQKIRLVYNEFAYKKTKDTYKLVNRPIFNRIYAKLQIKDRI